MVNPSPKYLSCDDSLESSAVKVLSLPPLVEPVGLLRAVASQAAYQRQGSAAMPCVVLFWRKLEML